MSLIQSPRFWPGDVEHWHRLERYDHIAARTVKFRRAVQQAEDAIRAFTALPGGGYCGVSWGKDSVVVAHLVRQVAPSVPLVWIRIGAADNPDCVLVRDAFLAAHPGPYDEFTAPDVAFVDGELPTGARNAGFEQAAEKHGDRYVSGIRADESSARTLRVRRWGTSTARTCAPLAYWTGQDVFAYLAAHDLPVHPVYALTMSGRLERERLRVASLGGKRGTGMGRREWELAYYGDVLRPLQRGG